MHIFAPTKCTVCTARAASRWMFWITVAGGSSTTTAGRKRCPNFIGQKESTLCTPPRKSQYMQLQGALSDTVNICHQIWLATWHRDINTFTIWFLICWDHTVKKSPFKVKQKGAKGWADWRNKGSEQALKKHAEGRGFHENVPFLYMAPFAFIKMNTTTVCWSTSTSGWATLRMGKHLQTTACARLLRWAVLQPRRLIADCYFFIVILKCCILFSFSSQLWSSSKLPQVSFLEQYVVST